MTDPISGLLVATPAEQWHEDLGACLWWRIPIEEPPYVGNPLYDDWEDGYYTHFSTLPIPAGRIQLRRTKGWRMPHEAVKVDRTTRWGNPFRVGQPPDTKALETWQVDYLDPAYCTPCQDAAEAVRRFRQTMQINLRLIEAAQKQLAGKNLACWCALDAPCHADALLDFANGPSL